MKFQRKTGNKVVLLLLIALCLAAISGLTYSAYDGAYAANDVNYQPGDRDELGFTVDTGEFNSGIVIRSAGSNFQITLRLTGERKNPANTSFYFRAQEKAGTVDPNEEWQPIRKDDGSADFVTITLNDISGASSAAGGIYRKYLYFRTVLVKEGDGSASDKEYYEYIYDRYFDLIVDNNSGALQTYAITGVEATYQEGLNEDRYDTQNPAWVSTWVKLKAYTAVADYDASATESNSHVYYSLDNGKTKLPATPKRDVSDKWYHEVYLNETFDGEVMLYSTDVSGSVETGYTAARVQVKLDTATPTFGIQATMELSTGTADYATGDWAPGDVTYVITPGGECISGARYYYMMTLNGIPQDWKELTNMQNGVYRLPITETVTSLRFQAISNAGKVNVATGDYRTNIDKLTPFLNVSAVDAKGMEIRSMDTAAGSGYRVGYASDSLTFTIRNTVQNTASVTYSYSVNGGEFQTIAPANNSYQVRINVPTKESKYIFRAMTAAGLYRDYDFTAAVLSSGVDLTMDDLDYEINDAGWSRYEIPVYLNLPDFLSVDNEYRIYREIGNNPATATLMTATLVSSQNGIAKYQVMVDLSVQNAAVSFYAYNMANDVSPRVSTPTLNLDLSDPAAEVVKRVGDSGLALEEDDWAKDRVTIEITPPALGEAGYNISGISCFVRYGAVQGPEVEMVGGKYAMTVIHSGTYEFLLVSGAGRRTPLTVVVNIDNTEINFTGIEAITKDGTQVYQNSNYTNPKLVSQDITIDFITNHAGHFIYYWCDYTGGTLPDDLSAYTRGEGEQCIIKMPEQGGSATKNYAFILQSKAVDNNGNRSTSLPIHIVVKYDVRDFRIIVVVDQSQTDRWVNNDIAFDLTAPDGVNVRAWEYSLDKGETWLSIETTGVTGSTTFTFGGVEQYFRGKKLDGTAYNGPIRFRAVNDAGHASEVAGTEFNVQIDKTTPLAEYCVVQTAGEMIENNGVVNVLSVNGLFLSPTDETIDPVFHHLAPVTYYYQRTDSSSPVVGTDWLELDGRLQATGYYFLRAINRLNGVSDDMRFCFTKDGELIQAIIEGGTLNAAGIYEFPWAESALINITPQNSGTDLYYWYQICDNGTDNGEWKKYNETAKAKEALQTIAFVGMYTSVYPDAIVRNMDATVRFKITNQSGAELELDRRFRIRIDVNTPEFDIETSVNGTTVSESDREAWQPDAVDIKIVNAAYNPSGVRYTYRIDRVGSAADEYQKLPGKGTYFSTDDLIGFDGNGIVTITVRATRNAILKDEGGETHWQKTITLKVDSQTPEFDLTGQYTVPNTANVRELKSGEWTNADEVRISLIEKVNPISAISYRYYYDNQEDAMSEWENSQGGYAPLVQRRISTLHVIAVTESGREYRKDFDVKIDNEAPVIYSGMITNSPDSTKPNRYYIDQVITYVEPNLKSAYYNNFPLSNGQIIATNTVDNSNGGYVHIVVEDMAGNKAELIFYMTIFDLTVNTITLSLEDRELLAVYEDHFGKAKDTLTDSRRAYFETNISRLYDRIATLEKQVADYRGFLQKVNDRGDSAFELRSDYADMETYINYFETDDTLVRYPDWLQTTITEGRYASYYSKLKTAYESLKAQMAKVLSLERAVTALPATNMVARTDYNAILRVYGDYESLTTDQQSVFTPTLYTKMIELKRRCEVLLLQDESTGVSIDGEDLAAGATIEVFEYDRSSEFFNNAQYTVWQTIPDTGSRAVIYIMKLGLTGYGSTQQSGTITVTLPIPVGYRDYILFSVYRLSTDGTVAPMQDITINGDGESIYFNTNRVEETYILATTANVVPRPATEKVYGTIGTIEIDAAMLTYITFAAVGLFLVILAVLIIVGIRHKRFLQNYDKARKNSLLKRGIKRIPKGNRSVPAANPARPEERVDDTHKYFLNNRQMKKAAKAEKKAAEAAKKAQEAAAAKKAKKASKTADASKATTATKTPTTPKKK